MSYWFVGSSSGYFDKSKRYNPICSLKRVMLSNHFGVINLEQQSIASQLAEVARIMCIRKHNVPPYLKAVNLDHLDCKTILKRKLYTFPDFIKAQARIWRRKRPLFDRKSMQPRVCTFKSLLPQINPPKLHALPSNLPPADKFPLVKSLKVPPSTKSFMLKLAVNGLPTANRLKHFAQKIPSCPICKVDLSLEHFFEGSCHLKFNQRLLDWCSENNIGIPALEIKFSCDIKSLINLVYVCSVWKTTMKLCHSEHIDLVVASKILKDCFKLEIKKAVILFPKIYGVLNVSFWPDFKYPDIISLLN